MEAVPKFEAKEFFSKYAPESVLTEAFRCRQFEYELNEFIKRYLTPVTYLQQMNFYQLVQTIMKVAKSEANNRERSQKMKLSRGASSSLGKTDRESQIESVLSHPPPPPPPPPFLGG